MEENIIPHEQKNKEYYPEIYKEEMRNPEWKCEDRQIRDTPNITPIDMDTNEKQPRTSNPQKNIGYTIRTHGKYNYEIDQIFKENSKLLKYLCNKAPGTFKEGKREYPLGKIIGGLFITIEQEKMYEKDNPKIIKCDHFLRYTLDIEKFHLMDLKEIISEHLENNTNIPRLRNFFYTDYEFPPYIREYKKETYLNEIPNPRWAKSNKTTSNNKNKIKPFAFYEIDTDLLKVLSNAGYLRTNEYTARFCRISKMLHKYLESNPQTFKNKKTHKNIFNIKNTPLEILGVKTLYRYQIDTILRSKLEPTETEAEENQDI